MNTSIKAWIELVNSSALGEMQGQVFDLLDIEGPLTGNEVSSRIPGGHRRLSELESMGVVCKCGIKKDADTGKDNVLWQVGFAKTKPFSKRQIAYMTGMSNAYDAGHNMGENKWNYCHAI